MATSTLATEAQLFAQRLRQAMLDAGLKASPTVLAHTFNLRYWGQSISVHAARNWLMGTSLPTQDKLVVLADCLKVNVSELRFGVLATADTTHTAPSNTPFTLQDREMITAFLNLPIEQQRLVRELIYALKVRA